MFLSKSPISLIWFLCFASNLVFWCNYSFELLYSFSFIKFSLKYFTRFPLIPSKPMFHIFPILPFVCVSICRFPNTFAIHLTFFEISGIRHSYLPWIFAFSIKFIIGVHSFVRIVIIEVLFSFSVFRSLLKISAISTFLCGQVPESIKLVVLPCSFVFDSVTVTNYSLSVLFIPSKLALVEILLWHYLNTLTLLDQCFSNYSVS